MTLDPLHRQGDIDIFNDTGYVTSIDCLKFDVGGGGHYFLKVRAR